MTSFQNRFVFDKQELNTHLLALSNWDFSLTKQKLLEADYAGWTQERADKAESDYKKYLALTKACNGMQPVPNGDIDRFWHEHILDTRRYAEDCQSFFGYFLHHYPYFGMRGEADHSNWLSTIEQSNASWSNAFGENLYNTTAGTRCPSTCSGSGLSMPMKCPQACPD